MRILCALLRLGLIAVFLAALGTAALVVAAPDACPHPGADCAQGRGAGHYAMVPDAKPSPRPTTFAPEGCLQHCLGASLTPEPMQPAARAERVSRLLPPVVLSLLALLSPEPEGPPPRA
ncbi:hypothetical protein PUH89_08490 [Rhodobacter capsulatus]|uniref:Uncharacterized protein n=1 Tax=Rhodobacter capsulatus TaxID=1061 RepID=A0A1G7QRV1_RHOCA|nr:hypothetical protein [Rhodobacter capsulatus]WER10994.1 hypothetical protein PUH89_08490 [Rhodobacter capsulatus]SDG01256.1 hypothetical protein SAMN04244550_03266 [Rhodobacter capsulatus]